MTRWLSDDEQRTWLAFLAATELLTSSLEAQLQRDAGIPLGYYSVLAQLSAAPDRTRRMAELANTVNASPSRLSHAVAKLEERGWVLRRQCADDRRGTLAVLTDAGFDALRQYAPGHVQAVREGLFDALTEDQVGQLEQICLSVVERLQANSP